MDGQTNERTHSIATVLCRALCGKNCIIFPIQPMNVCIPVIVFKWVWHNLSITAGKMSQTGVHSLSWRKDNLTEYRPTVNHFCNNDHHHHQNAWVAEAHSADLVRRECPILGGWGCGAITNLVQPSLPWMSGVFFNLMEGISQYGKHRHTRGHL